MIRYIDTSCLLRHLFDEAGARAPLTAAHVATCVLTRVEVARAIERVRLTSRANVAHIEAAAEAALERFIVSAIDPIVLQRAYAPFGVAVRALDAIHVASAETFLGGGQALEFWTHDERQAAAARARGLAVFGVLQGS